MYESRHIDGAGSFRARTSPAPVLSLTVVDARTLQSGGMTPASRVLVAVRRPSCNATHPSVVSVPTQRLPRVLMDAIIDERDGLVVAAHRSLLDGSDSALRNGHGPVIYAAEALLARKVGLAEELERSRARFTASLGERLLGDAFYDNFGANGVSEPIDMLNVVIALTEGHDALPEQTSSYSHLIWVPAVRFLNGVRKRDPAAMDPRLDPLKLCVHGLCLNAAETTIRALLGNDMPQRVRAAAHRAG